MAQRTRAYFFGSGGDKFLTGNKPTQPTFQDLLDSCYFKSESGDRATNALYGVSILATTAVSKARSGAGVVLPAHLPVLTYGASNTELVTPGTGAYEGIKITAVNKTDRLDYQVDFDPTSLTAKATIAAGDYVVIVDSADSNKPKKALLATLTGSTLFTRTSTVITPTTANDDLDMSGGDVTADSFLLKAAASTYINPLEYTGNNGAALWVSGGAGQHASAAKTGGALYLNPGVGVHGGANGNIYLGWDGANNMGNIAIRGVPVAGYEFTVHDDAYFDGLVYIKPTAPPGGGVTITTTPVYGSDGNIYYKTFKDFMTSILGGTAPSGDSILLYAGSAYSSIPIGSTKDAFLHTNAGTGALEMATLDMTNRVVNSSVATGAAIAWAKMAGLTVSKVPQINSSGVIEASAIPITALAFLDATSSIQTQFNAVNKNVTSWTTISTTPALPLTVATMKDVIFLDTNSAGVTVTLPVISTLVDGQTFEGHQYGANAGTFAAGSGDGGFTNAVNSNAPTITIGGDGKFIKLRADAATKIWYVVAQG